MTAPAPVRAVEHQPADIKRARKILASLCENGLLGMSIPVRQDDEDMVLSRVIEAAALYLATPTQATQGGAEPFPGDLCLRCYGSGKDPMPSRAAAVEPAQAAPAAVVPERDSHFGGNSYEASMLRNLLARIHGDGGHYLDAHGLDKAIEDADLLVANWRAAAPDTTAKGEQA